MTNSKIALAMISKGTEEEQIKLKKIIEDFTPHIDGIFITLTDNKNELEKLQKLYPSVHFSYNRPITTITEGMIKWCRDTLKYEPFVKLGEEIFIFDEARNFNFSQVPDEYEWILWMDCDDVFRGVEKIRELIQNSDAKGGNIVYLNYLYQVEFDENQNIKQVVTQNPRERFVRNGLCKWQGAIHEVLVEQFQGFKLYNPDCDLVHVTDHEHRISSLIRNIKSLEVTLCQTLKKDARFIYYLAKCLFDLHDDKFDMIAKDLMFEYILGEHKTNWEEERAQVWNYIADIQIRHKEYDEAIKALMNGLIDDPGRVDLYVLLAYAYMHKTQWEKALFWLERGQGVPDKTTFLFSSPRDRRLKTLEILCNCTYRLGKLGEFRNVYRQMITEFPNTNVSLNVPIGNDVAWVKEKLHIIDNRAKM